ncbi:MAG: helix-turn-helix domain-containing protein [Thermomicrobiales bacterium]
MITVRDIIEEALPEEALVVAGEQGLSGEVTWATRPRPSPPAFGHLSGGELVLLTPGVLTSLDERLTLDAAIRQLAGFGVSAVGFAGRPTAAARAAANLTGVPLIQLSPDADLALLEREAAHLVAVKRREAQRKGSETSRRLMELAIAGESLADLTTTLSENARRDVFIVGRDGRLLAMTSPSGQVPSSAVIMPLLEAGRPLELEWVKTNPGGSMAEPATTVLPWDGVQYRVVAPILGRDGYLGLLSMLIGSAEASAEERALASRGAAASAIVLAREHAAAVARQELELNVLDEILDGALRSEISLIQQARRLGHALDQPHAALVARFESTGGTQPRASLDATRGAVEAALSRLGVSVLWRIRHNNIEVVWNPAQIEQGADFPIALQQELMRVSRPGLAGVVSLGAGAFHAGTSGIRQSHQEAKQALTMSRRLYGPGQVTRFEDLGIYRLLFAARDLPELRSFHDDALNLLIDYDRQHGAELLRTLGAFFAGRCGPKETAAILGVHRNTVLYRLERIRDLTGFDLDDADVRLRLQLAYSAHIALFAEPTGVIGARESRTA